MFFLTPPNKHNFSLPSNLISLNCHCRCDASHFSSNQAVIKLLKLFCFRSWHWPIIFWPDNILPNGHPGGPDAARHGGKSTKKGLRRLNVSHLMAVNKTSTGHKIGQWLVKKAIGLSGEHQQTKLGKEDEKKWGRGVEKGIFFGKSVWMVSLTFSTLV